MNNYQSNQVTKLAIKNAKTYQQLEYLKQAKSQGFLPRGIAEQMKFVSAIQDDVLQYSLQDYMYFCGSRILDLLIIYYTKWNNITRANYYTALAKFKNNVSSEDFGNLETCLKRKIQKEKAHLV